METENDDQFELINDGIEEILPWLVEEMQLDSVATRSRARPVAQRVPLGADDGRDPLEQGPSRRRI